MEIKYKCNEDDVIYNSNNYSIDKQKILKLFKFYRYLLLLEVFIFIVLFIIFINQIKTLEMLLLSVAFILIIITTYIKMRVLLKANKIINYSVSKNKNEEISIIIKDDGIIEKNGYNQQIFYQWQKIKEVFINEKYIDIMIKRSSPLTIPLRIFKHEDDLDKFLESIDSKLKGNKIYKLK